MESQFQGRPYIKLFSSNNYGGEHPEAEFYYFWDGKEFWAEIFVGGQVEEIPLTVDMNNLNPSLLQDPLPPPWRKQLECWRLSDGL